MRYTLRHGYDRQIKRKFERISLFAVPFAVLAIVGVAALTSNTTSGPGVGSPSDGTGGHSTVAKTFKNASSTQRTDGSRRASVADSKQSSSSASDTASDGQTNTAKSSSTSKASADHTSSSPQTSSTTAQPAGSSSSQGSDSSNCGCDVQGAVDTVTDTVDDTVNNTVNSVTNTVDNTVDGASNLLPSL